MAEIELVLYDTGSEKDAYEIEKIISEYYSGSPWPVTKEKIMKGDTVYYRALLEGQQIGITGYIPKTPTLVETAKTTVFKEFRGKGIGRQLSQAIEDECKKLGKKKIMTTIFHTNHSMIHIKLQQGYIIEGYHQDHEAPGFHEYSLGKILK